MTPQASHGDGWIERYEQLRQHALGQAAPTAGWLFGLEALLQNGMAVWMRAVPANVIEREETTAVPVTSGWLAARPRETTLVLAEMTWPQIFQIKPEELNAR